MRARIMAAALTAAFLVVGLVAPAVAGPKPTKHWNLYQDKLGAYVCTTGDPKGQTLIAHPFATQAECLAAMTTPPTIEYALTPASPNGAADWYVSDVSLAWTVTFLPGLEVAPEPVLDGCVDQSITADQPNTTYTCTATTVFGVSAGPVSVEVKRDATKPSITWSGGIKDGDSFEVGSVPDEPTIVADDAMSGVASSGLTGYSKQIGAHTLTATARDLAGNETVETRGYTVFAHPAQVVDPSKTDETCGGPGIVVAGGITIPTVTGVVYSIDAVVTAGGFVELPAGVYQVTAEPLPDYELKGYPVGGWSLEVVAADCIVSVATEAPIAAPETCDGSTVVPGSITIPAITGVEYLLDGLSASGVQTLGAGSYTVTAQPLFGYALTGDTSWPLTIDAATCLIEVTPTAPSATDETATASGFITIPLSEGVDYTLDGTAVAAGNHNVAPGPHTVVAQPQAGYALIGQTSWNLAVNAYIPPKTIQFVGRTGGDLGGTSLALPAGWQPGDLAVVFVARNVGGTTGVPTLPAGWTNWSSGYTSTTYPVASYRLMYRVLQPGDVGPTWAISYRSAGLMVYRNAVPGAASGYASRSTAAINLIVPALTLQVPGTSWVGGFGFMDSTNVSEAPPVSPFVANRMSGALLYGGRVGGWDTAGGVSTFPNTTVASGYYTAIAAASFELKLAP